MTDPSKSPPDGPAPPDDPLLEEQLDLAMAPYEHLLSPEVAAWMRLSLAELLLTHPVGSRLLDRLRPDPYVASSTEIARGEDGSIAAPADEKRKGVAK